MEENKPFIKIGLSAKELMERLRDLGDALKITPQQQLQIQSAVMHLSIELKKCLHDAHPNLRTRQKHEVNLMMPLWAIDILRNDYFKTGFDHISGYICQVGYENKIILFHQNVSIYSKDPALYHEVDISHILPLTGIIKQTNNT